MRFLTDGDITGLVSMEEAASAVERAFRSLSEGHAAMQTRSRTSTRIGKLSILGGVLDDEEVAGAKVYTTAPDGTFCFVIVLFAPKASRWLATLEGRELTRIRTAATSLLVAGHLAAADSSILTVFGSGVQAHAHAVAFTKRFPITEVRVVHRRPVPDLLVTLRSKTGAEVVQVDDADAAVNGAHLVVTATRADTPLFSGEALTAGAHVTSVGATLPASRELDRRTVERARVVVVESREQAKREAGNLIGAEVDWDRVWELTDLVSGGSQHRTVGEAITMFDSLGTGLADVAVAALCYRNAREQGIGHDLGQENGQDRWVG